MTSPRPLAQQISEIRVVIAECRREWPTQVSRGKMRQGEMHERLTRLDAALATLVLIAEHEDEVREVLREKARG